jgi:hypothetical protein
MAHEDLERAMAVQKELQEIFRKRVGGWRDEETLERVRRLCFESRMAANDGYCREQIGAIESHSNELFSARKHRKLDAERLTGAEYLRLQIVTAIHSLGSRLELLQRDLD